MQDDLSLEIDFLKQPMQEVAGQGQFDAAVIAIDSLNYLPDRKSVLDTFKGIHSVLNSGGVLMFDVHSTFKTDVIFMEGPFTFDNDRLSLIFGRRRKATRSIPSFRNSVFSSKRRTVFIDGSMSDMNKRHFTFMNMSIYYRKVVSQ